MTATTRLAGSILFGIPGQFTQASRTKVKAGRAFRSAAAPDGANPAAWRHQRLLEFDEMKALSAFPLFLLASLSGPAVAETAKAATLSGECQLVGPVADPTDECTALRVSFWTGVNTCLEGLQAEADAATGTAIANNAHAGRARFLTCDAATREKMGVLPN